MRLRALESNYQECAEWQDMVFKKVEIVAVAFAKGHAINLSPGPAGVPTADMRPARIKWKPISKL